VQSRVEDAFNVSLSEEYCAKLDRSQNSVMVIPEYQCQRTYELFIRRLDIILDFLWNQRFFRG